MGALKSVVGRIKLKPQVKTIAELTRFFGIIIAMYYNDHVIDGSLGARALRLVEEWRILHKAELLDDWSLAQARQPLLRIEPLE